MEKSMDPEMIRKIDSVLDRVKEPESNLSVAELGIIQKLRYNESKGDSISSPIHMAAGKPAVISLPS